MDFFSKLPLKKIMGVVVINQNIYLVMFDVSPNFQGLRRGNSREGMERNGELFLLHFRFLLITCVSLFLIFFLVSYRLGSSKVGGDGASI